MERKECGGMECYQNFYLEMERRKEEQTGAARGKAMKKIP